jgi:hypothetical protein
MRKLQNNLLILATITVSFSELGTALGGNPTLFCELWDKIHLKRNKIEKHLPVDKMRPSILFIGKCFVFYWLIYFFKKGRGKGYAFL